MPFPNLSRTIQGRAIRQAGANIESTEAVVTRTYADTLGNITAADVRVKGAVKALVRVPNASGLKLYQGASVEIRFVQGSKHFRQITGGAGSSTATATNQSAGGPPADPPISDYNAGNVPVLLQSADATDSPGGYVEAAGANVAFVDTPPTAGSGGPVNGQRVITARPLVATALPDPAQTALPDGTLLDLADGSGNPLGLYRLEKAAGVWRRRDAGGTGGAGASISVVSLAPKSLTFPAAGRNYWVVADFSAAGQFTDIGFQPVLIPDNPTLIVSPNYALWALGKAAWTVYVPAGASAYGTSPVTFSGTLVGRGWTGASASNVAASWSGPTLIG